MKISLKKKLLKIIAPKSFNDGLNKCNEVGMKLISKKYIEKLLDVGCGDGDLTKKFADVAEPKKIFGIEYVDEFRKVAEKRGIKCIKSDLNKRWGYPNNFFDIVISSQNIEHVHNTRLYVEECYRCLKWGGTSDNFN